MGCQSNLNPAEFWVDSLSLFCSGISLGAFAANRNICLPPHMPVKPCKSAISGDQNEWVAACKKVGCRKSTHGLHKSSVFVAVSSPQGPTSGGFPLRPAAKAPSQLRLHLLLTRGILSSVRLISPTRPAASFSMSPEGVSLPTSDLQDVNIRTPFYRYSGTLRHDDNQHNNS